MAIPMVKRTYLIHFDRDFVSLSEDNESPCVVSFGFSSFNRDSPPSDSWLAL